MGMHLTSMVSTCWKGKQVSSDDFIGYVFGLRISGTFPHPV